LPVIHTLASWALSLVLKKMKCCEYEPSTILTVYFILIFSMNNSTELSIRNRTTKTLFMSEET